MTSDARYLGGYSSGHKYTHKESARIWQYNVPSVRKCLCVKQLVVSISVRRAQFVWQSLLIDQVILGLIGSSMVQVMRQDPQNLLL